MRIISYNSDISLILNIWNVAFCLGGLLAGVVLSYNAWSLIAHTLWRMGGSLW